MPSLISANIIKLIEIPFVLFENVPLQHLLNVFLHLGGSDGGGETLDDGAVAVDEELREIPLDGAAEGALGHRFQILVNRMGVVTVHLNLGHKGESDAMVDAAELGNLLV